MSRIFKLFVTFLMVLFFNLFSWSNTTKDFDFPEETTLSELSNYTKDGKYGMAYAFNETENKENEFIFVWNQNTENLKCIIVRKTRKN